MQSVTLSMHLVTCVNFRSHFGFICMLNVRIEASEITAAMHASKPVHTAPPVGEGKRELKQDCNCSPRHRLPHARNHAELSVTEIQGGQNELEAHRSICLRAVFARALQLSIQPSHKPTKESLLDCANSDFRSQGNSDFEETSETRGAVADETWRLPHRCAQLRPITR